MTVFLIIVAAIVVYAAFKLADDIVEHTAYLRSLEDGSDEIPDGDWAAGSDGFHSASNTEGADQHHA